MRWVWRLIRFLRGNCEVCRNRGAVSLRFAQGQRALRPLSLVIPCPHCTHPGELLRNIPCRAGGSWDGGDAA